MQAKTDDVQAMGRKTGWRHDIAMNKGLYLLSIPIIAFFLIFNYAPMAGLVIAFQDFKPQRGILGSQWVSFDNFVDFFTNPSFASILRNTLVISLLGLVIAYPMAIIFALQLNEIGCKRFKKAIQTISYMPYFISLVVICGLVIEFCASNGVVTNIFCALTGRPKENLLTNPNYFWAINLLSDLWQNLGYSSIIYIAALSGISPELHEAAIVDGANILKRIWHVDLPGIAPTISILLIMSCGSILSVGYEKIYLLQNSLNLDVSEVISTYVYKQGIASSTPQYSYATAIGLFNSGVNLFFVLLVNKIADKVNGSGLW